MHRTFLAAAILVVLPSVSAFAGPRSDIGAQQRISANSQVVAGRAQAEPRARLREAATLRQVATLTRTDGKPLSCAEIRAMDEVELITDESYCR